MTDILHGGRADNMPRSAFNQAALAEGIRYEREHTTSNQIASEIARDHLAEDPDYYRKLSRMEHGTQGKLILSSSDVEDALRLVRQSSYEEGYKDGHQTGWTEGQKEGYRRAIASLHSSTAQIDKVKEIADRWFRPDGSAKTRATTQSMILETMASEKIELQDAARLFLQAVRLYDKDSRWLNESDYWQVVEELPTKIDVPATLALKTKSLDHHYDSVSKHAHSLSAKARGARSKEYFHHTKARIANKIAAEHHRGMSRMVRGLGQPERAHTHESLARSHDDHAAYHDKERRTHKVRKGIVSRLLRKGINLPPQEIIDGLVVKALAHRMKKKEWISAKIAIIMKDGIRGKAVHQAQAVAVAHKLWAKKRNRRRPPAEAKSVDVVWLLTGGIAVNADELQYKNTDGTEDGLNKERRDESNDQEFDPLKVPPIAVWRANTDSQVYVVDGHKRLATAKKRGIPNIRAFFIEASSFDDAKKKGERLNEKMNTKAFDETKHPRGQPGNAGQFAPGGSGPDKDELNSADRHHYADVDYKDTYKVKTKDGEFVVKHTTNKAVKNEIRASEMAHIAGVNVPAAMYAKGAKGSTGKKEQEGAVATQMIPNARSMENMDERERTSFIRSLPQGEAEKQLLFGWMIGAEDRDNWGNYIASGKSLYQIDFAMSFKFLQGAYPITSSNLFRGMGPGAEDRTVPASVLSKLSEASKKMGEKLRTDGDEKSAKEVEARGQALGALVKKAGGLKGLIGGHQRVTLGDVIKATRFVSVKSLDDVELEDEIIVRAKDALGHGSYKKDEQPTHKEDYSPEDVGAEWGQKAPEAVRAHYQKNISHVLGKMPSQCRKLAVEAVRKGSLTWHTNLDDLRKAWDEQTAKAGVKSAPIKRLGGFVGHRVGGDAIHLNIDGGFDDLGDKDTVTQGLYAHELGHCVDAGYRFSSTPEWKEAWTDEIVNGKTKISVYANRSPAEGFAELHRAMCVVGVDKIKHYYPKVFAFLQSKELV